MHHRSCTLAALCLLTAITRLFAATPLAAATDQPNILLIVADDLGWKDVGFHGSDIKTPALDQLAAGGARLEQFYAQPMCTPSRAALMTGRYPLRYGLQTAVISASHTYGLPTDEYLLPQALKAAGYNTAIIGKWHLGHADQKYWPRQRGFDYQYGPLIGEIDYFTHEAEGVVDWYRDSRRVREEGYSTSLLGDDAVRFIERQTTVAPFFLYLAFNAAHTPYEATQDYLDQYSTIADPSRRAYAGSITAMDAQIARVVAVLTAKGLRDNTLILFLSDNGGTRNAMFTGAIADVSKIKIPCDNGPYREGKGTLYEGGTRVVALANWPQQIPAGGAVNELIHIVDLYPTLVGLAGADSAAAKPLDGVNAWPTISAGQPSPRTEIVYNVEPYRAAVRTGEWKLVWKTLLPAAVELYNIPQDPSEQHNVAADHADVVATLQGRASELAATMAPPLFLQTEFQALRARIGLPPSLPDEQFEFNAER